MRCPHDADGSGHARRYDPRAAQRTPLHRRRDDPHGRAPHLACPRDRHTARDRDGHIVCDGGTRGAGASRGACRAPHPSDLLRRDLGAVGDCRASSRARDAPPHRQCTRGAFCLCGGAAAVCHGGWRRPLGGEYAQAARLADADLDAPRTRRTRARHADSCSIGRTPDDQSE